jgi:hypothetical protein
MLVQNAFSWSQQNLTFCPRKSFFSDNIVTPVPAVVLLELVSFVLPFPLPGFTVRTHAQQ